MSPRPLSLTPTFAETENFATLAAMKPHTPALDPNAITCPICGRENQCAVTIGQDPSNCWCFAPEITVGEAVVAAVPLAKRRTACVCADCISRLTAEN